MGLNSAIDTTIAAIENSAKTETDLGKLSIGAAALKQLTEITKEEDIQDDVYSIGIPGTLGFGVAAIRDEHLPAGYIKLSGHTDKSSENYGCVMDEHGSVFENVPPHFYKMTGNVISIAKKPTSGYSQYRAFMDSPNGFLHFKYLAGNEGGKLVSKQLLDPLSTHSNHNPIGDLVSDPDNNYAGFVDACKDAGFKTTTIFEWVVLQNISLAQSQSGASTAFVAFNGVSPFFPKGNLASSLADNSDNSVTFIESGYSNCALTGSANKLEATTHNGQKCGIADVNGNMWKIVTGLTYLAKTGATCDDGGTTVTMTGHGLQVDDIIHFGGTPSSGSTYNTGSYTVDSIDTNSFTVSDNLERKIEDTDGVYSSRYFRILKVGVKGDDLTSDNLLDDTNYDLLDLTGIVESNSGWAYLGNGSNTVLNFSTDANSNDFKLASCGIPKGDGTSGSADSTFGNGATYKYLRHGCVPIVGVSWDNSLPVGSFSLSLDNYSVGSHYAVGGFASVTLS